MSSREKKLLIFFAAAIFIILNFLVFNIINVKRTDAHNKVQAARVKLENAQQIRDSSDQVEDEMAWLAEHQPQPAEDQDVQSKLQKFCEKEAIAAGLTMKNQKLDNTDKTGKFYYRAKIQISVTGGEKELYAWFDRLNDPAQFRMATSIRLSPNTKDDTQIDCSATIEQWFVPLAPAS